MIDVTWNEVVSLFAIVNIISSTLRFCQDLTKSRAEFYTLSCQMLLSPSRVTLPNIQEMVYINPIQIGYRNGLRVDTIGQQN